MQFQLFICLVVLFSSIGAWEQVIPKCLRSIFPRIDKGSVWKLTFQLNHQDSVNDSIALLNPWLDDNWVDAPLSIAALLSSVKTTPKPTLAPTWENEWFPNELIDPNPNQNIAHISLNDKEFARSQAIGFIEHRWTVKQYVRHLFRAFQTDKRFTLSDAERMRQVFWQTDLVCINYFRCTAPTFLLKASQFLATSLSPDVIENALIFYSAAFYKLPPVGVKLDWELSGGRMPGQGYYSENAYKRVFTLAVNSSSDYLV